MNNLYRTEEFESFFNSCDFIERYGTKQELFYPMLVAWSRGYDEGYNEGLGKGEDQAKDEIYYKIFGMKEMGG